MQSGSLSKWLWLCTYMYTLCISSFLNYFSFISFRRRKLHLAIAIEVWWWLLHLLVDTTTWQVFRATCLYLLFMFLHVAINQFSDKFNNGGRLVFSWSCCLYHGNTGLPCFTYFAIIYKLHSRIVISVQDRMISLLYKLTVSQSCVKCIYSFSLFCTFVFCFE